MTWQAGSLPDPASTYYVVERLAESGQWVEVAHEQVLPGGAGDQGKLRLQTSTWGPGDYTIQFVRHVWHYVPPPKGCPTCADSSYETVEPTSNSVQFHIP